MSIEKVLTAWDDYDKKKKKAGLNPEYFLWDESWEIHYLKSKIKNVYPHLNDLTIFQAIEASCKSRIVLRKDFANTVIERLNQYTSKSLDLSIGSNIGDA